MALSCSAAAAATASASVLDDWAPAFACSSAALIRPDSAAMPRASSATRFPARAVLEAASAMWLRSDTHSDEPRRSEEHTSELQSRLHLVCRLLLEKKK